eukprot:10961676-Prorocentrum_lima.AAC.1
MTSSLVGSEMCIRDSWVGINWTGRNHGGRGKTIGAVGTFRKKWRGGPVSYTHLTLPTICSV